MKLGSLYLKNNLVLSPMMNITSAPYRTFCRHFFEIGLVVVPMLYTKRIVKSPKSIEHELLKIEHERPISVQLIGFDPNSLKKAIDYLDSYEFDALDLNAGCPSKRAIKSKEGGYLLKDLKQLEQLIDIGVKYSSRPVSLKTRLGFDHSDNIDELVKLINNSGLDFITIHARTVNSRFFESGLNLDALRKFKKMINKPVIGNGDINNPKFAKDFINYTNVDALMIGRGSIGYPEIFHHIYEYLTKGIEYSHDNSIKLMIEYSNLYEKYIDEFLNGIRLKYSHEDFKFVELKRNAIWFTKEIKDSTSIRRDLSNTKNLEQLKEVLLKINGN